MTAGGIIIPDTAKEKPVEGEAIAAGPVARDTVSSLPDRERSNQCRNPKSHKLCSCST
jgi:co-chaperonin GroES (HSP10)